MIVAYTNINVNIIEYAHKIQSDAGVRIRGNFFCGSSDATRVHKARCSLDVLSKVTLLTPARKSERRLRQKTYTFYVASL